MSNVSASSFDIFFSTQLNEAQQQAVTHQRGSLLVIAGAGSGKTRVITARIINLMLTHNVPASAIIALTFTNKAANEMKERIIRILGQHKELPFIGTFHSYCVRILKRYQAHLTAPFFSILDEDDQQKLIASILQRYQVQKNVTVKQIAYQISQLKNRFSHYDNLDPAYTHPLFQEIYQAYETEKRMSKCLDFDDLLLDVLKLLQNNPTIKTIFQQGTRHILVDEYQDTNLVQHELLKELALADKKLAIDSICAVGDEDQSIYSWRGATIANMMNFKKDFSQTTTIKIEQNYRSVQPILDAANAVIVHNQQRNPKTLWSAKKGFDRIRTITCMTEYQEAGVIAQALLLMQRQKKLQSCALLYRTHAQSRALEEALIKHAIAYKIIGGIQFYERKEIKDLLAYLRLIINPFDRISLLRIINTPTRGLGAKFEEQVADVWNKEPLLNFHNLLNHIMTAEQLTNSKRSSLKKFIHIFENLTSETNPSKAFEQIVARSTYIAYLKETCDPQDLQTRLENIEELRDAIDHGTTQGISTIADFIERVTLMQEATKAADTRDYVSLMTLHAAKGLEFEMVIIPGLEEGLLPASRSLTSDDALEEERRLLYVGITRAQEHLLLTHAQYRYTYGQLADQKASRFLHEIPNRLAQLHDGSSWNNFQAHQFFANWFHQSPHASVITFGQNNAPSISSTHKQQDTSLSSTQKLISPPQKKSPWRPHQPVSHATYGTGIVQKTEERDKKIYVTVQFKIGTKKIVSDFLTPL